MMEKLDEIKIIKKTSNILDLQVSKISYSYFLRFVLGFLGFFALFIPGIATILNKESVMLECEKLELNYVNCNLTKSNLLRTEKMNFSQLKKAEMQTYEGDETTTYRVNLLTNKETISLTTKDIASESESEKKVTEINNFIKKNDSRNRYLTIYYTDSFFVYILGFMLIISGGILLIFAFTYFEDTNYIFDKEKNTLWKVQKNIFSSKQLIYCQLSIITEAIVTETESEDNGKIYNLVLKRKLSDIELKTGGKNQEQYTQIKENINDFLALENNDN